MNIYSLLTKILLFTCLVQLGHNVSEYLKNVPKRSWIVSFLALKRKKLLFLYLPLILAFVSLIFLSASKFCWCRWKQKSFHFVCLPD